MKVVLMAGGFGTRIAKLAPNLPKPMLPICGKPILERQIECLKSQGFTDIIITVSYLKEVITDYFKDGAEFGVCIRYFEEEKPLGNAGALFLLKDELKEDFLLLNADSMFDVDFRRFVAFHNEKGALASLFTHPNSHPYDSGLLVADEQGTVVRWLTKEENREGFFKNRVNAGLHILSPKLLKERPEKEKIDLDRDVLRKLVGTGSMYVYDSPEYVKDMGTPERYATVCKEFADGIVQARNLRNKQRAIFLDRDGTINRDVCFLKNIEDLELLPGAAEAIRKINESGYLAIVITNQPVIARGEVSVEELQQIHNKLETLLGAEGAYLNAIYYCPHHPDKGYAGERPEYKIKCSCRKPEPGLLIQAAKDFSIDLSASWMVGDSVKDVAAGKNAGCKTVYLGTEEADRPDAVAASLCDAVEYILQRG